MTQCIRIILRNRLIKDFYWRRKVTGLNKSNPGSDYAQLFAEVKDRVRSAQYAALKAVNTELVGLYWDIGRMIAERQKKAGWGRSVVETLSLDLRHEFPGVAGFSVQNLWYMRQFYLEYSGHEKLQPLVGEIAWAHNLVVMSKCKDPLAGVLYPHDPKIRVEST